MKAFALIALALSLDSRRASASCEGREEVIRGQHFPREETAREEPYDTMRDLTLSRRLMVERV